MRPYISYTTRSAEIEKANLKVYYGSAVTDETTGDYCFIIYKNGKEVFRRTNSQLLEITNGEGLKDLLIAGLIAYLK
jgi:hypothetical protein